MSEQFELKSSLFSLNLDRADGRILSISSQEGLLPITDHGVTIGFGGRETSTNRLLPVKMEWGVGRVEAFYEAEDFAFSVITFLAADGKTFGRKAAITNAAPKTLEIATRAFLDIELQCDKADFVRHKLWASSLTAFFARTDRGSIFSMFDHPFGQVDIDGNRFRVYEHTAIKLRCGESFSEGTLYTGPTSLTGRMMCQAAIDELDYAYTNSWQPTTKTKVGKSWWSRGEADLDCGEVEAARALVKSLVPWKKGSVTSCHVPWCENDYEFIISKQEDEAVYARMIRLLSEVGCQNTLFTPNGGLPLRRTDGGWMHVMWLGIADPVCGGEWTPETPLPDNTQRLLGLAKVKNVGVLAYVNPAFRYGGSEDDQRMLEDGSRHWEICYANKEYMQRFIRTLIDFKNAYGLAGYCFDFIGESPECHDPNHDHVPGKHTRLPGWRGFQSMLKALNEADPDIIIDGRLCTFRFAPFSTLGLTYPHPFICDEQPNHMTSWPDLSLDRVFANFQRRVAYWGRNRFFVPNYKLPGFMTHQQIRTFRWKHSWDRTGWKYNVLSSIACAGINNVINYLPVREQDEFDSFSQQDRWWLRKWLRWAEDNADLLLNAKDIFGEPCPERVDGIPACADGRGVVFLINPNYRAKKAYLTIGDCLGLSGASSWTLTELNPNEGAMLGSAKHGDAISITVPPHQVLVLQLGPGKSTPFVGRPQDWLDAEVKGWKLDDGTKVTFPYEFEQASGWQVDVVETETKPTHWVKFVCEWSPDPALKEKLNSQKTPLELDDHERIQPYLDPSRLLMSFMFRFPENIVQADMKVNGERVAVETSYLGSRWRVVEQEYRERNICGLYADLEGAIDLGATNKLELELAHYGPCEWIGAFVEHL